MAIIRERNFCEEYHLTPNKPSVDPSLLHSWQGIVNVLAKSAAVPAVLVMKIHPQVIEVAVASNSTSGNPYEAGETAELGYGLYCETVLRSRQSLLVPNAQSDPDWANNPDIKLGMIFYYGLPILWPDGSTFGTICMLDRQTHTPTEMTKELLQIMRQSVEADLKGLYQQQATWQITLQLNQALETTIASLVKAMSCRDPYTASHQTRVAKLAVEIAKKLDLSEMERHGLYLGGLIHDIGKIYVPAEILSRPGKLSAIEFELIKSHTTIGASIIEGITFPWPIHAMILQHHERLDGTGYPDGLAGDDIRLEVRILSVADVVEAMSSHRPYRSALGLDFALNEIEKGIGDRYDPDVVEACQAVFRDSEADYWSNWMSNPF